MLPMLFLIQTIPAFSNFLCLCLLFLSSLKYLQAKAPPAPLTAVEFRPGASVRQHRLHQLPAASAPEDWNIKEVFRWSLQSKQNIIQPNSQS
jgi:hypothetical protein